MCEASAAAIVRLHSFESKSYGRRTVAECFTRNFGRKRHTATCCDSRSMAIVRFVYKIKIRPAATAASVSAVCQDPTAAEGFIINFGRRLRDAVRRHVPFVFGWTVLEVEF